MLTDTNPMRGADQYSFMAISMIGYVKAISAATPPKSIEGVRKATVRFFESTLRIIERLDDPVIFLHKDYDLFRLTSEALVEANLLPEHCQENDRKNLIRSFVNLLASIEQPRTLSDEERAIAESLVRMLQVLYDAGCQEQYTNFMNKSCGHWHHTRF